MGFDIAVWSLALLAIMLGFAVGYYEECEDEA